MPSTRLIVSVMSWIPPIVYATLILSTRGRAPGGSILTWSSRGIESMEIVGLLGSIRASSISFECGTTNPFGLCRGGGRRSSPTSSSVWGAPRLAGASTFGASLTARFWPSASTTLSTSFSATTAVAAPASAITPSPPSTNRLASQRPRCGGSGTSVWGGGPPASAGGGGVPGALTRCSVPSDLLCEPRARGLRRGSDRYSPQREPALELGLHRQFGAHLRLELQLALGQALLRARGIRHERVPEAALVVVDEVDATLLGVVEGEHGAQQPLSVTRGLDRARHRVDADGEVFDAGRLRGIAQDHPAVAVAVVFGRDARPAVSAGGLDDLFHVAQRRFELARRERLEDDRGRSRGLDLVLGLERDVGGGDREQAVGRRTLHLMAAREDVAQPHVSRRSAAGTPTARAPRGAARGAGGRRRGSGATSSPWPAR